ncbi:MAG: extracellular solute-binding protein [Phycisphaerales bacterium JB038]
MRTLLAATFALLVILTFVGQFAVLPEEGTDRGMIHAFWRMESHPNVGGLIADYRQHYRETYGEDWPDIEPLLAAEQEAAAASSDRAAELKPIVEELRRQEQRFRDWYDATQDQPLDAIPRLVWGTDANPARGIQCQLFREWHLETYGEPVDIVTDPSTRGQTKTTKTIIQCIAGTGPDIIEVYGPAQLRQFVDSGIALDLTDRAREGSYGLDRIFPAAHSSLAYRGKQYGFPCNVGYVVLFYHKDLFAEAGLEAPTGPWTVDELIEIGPRLVDNTPGRRRYALIGMHPWPMALAVNGRFFNDDSTVSIYNSPQTVAAFRAFQELIYEHGLMPSPAETASMSAAGGFGESNIRLFIRKASAMVVGGRWDYATLAQYNRDRVIVPAIDRELAQTDLGETEREALQRIRTSLQVEVLNPLSEADDALMRSILTQDDQADLLQVGVAHIPNVSGEPVYEVAGRVALVNQASPLAEYAARFVEFLASERYNEQINGSFDSICGMPEYCTDANGIAGPPRALPGLEDFDSPIFVEAVAAYGDDWELSPFVGRQRFGELVGQVMDQLQTRNISPAEAARLCEDRINRQMFDNIKREPEQRALWEELTGLRFDPEVPLATQMRERETTPGDEGGGG